MFKTLCFVDEWKNCGRRHLGEVHAKGVSLVSNNSNQNLGEEIEELLLFVLILIQIARYLSIVNCGCPGSIM